MVRDIVGIVLTFLSVIALGIFMVLWLVYDWHYAALVLCAGLAMMIWALVLQEKWPPGDGALMLALLGGIVSSLMNLFIPGPWVAIPSLITFGLLGFAYTTKVMSWYHGTKEIRR